MFRPSEQAGRPASEEWVEAGALDGLAARVAELEARLRRVAWGGAVGLAALAIGLASALLRSPADSQPPEPAAVAPGSVPFRKIVAEEVVAGRVTVVDDQGRGVVHLAGIGETRGVGSIFVGTPGGERDFAALITPFTLAMDGPGGKPRLGLASGNPMGGAEDKPSIVLHGGGDEAPELELDATPSIVLRREKFRDLLRIEAKEDPHIDWWNRRRGGYDWVINH